MSDGPNLHPADDAPAETGSVVELVAPGDVLARYAGSLVDWARLWEREQKTGEWLCEPILPRGRAIATFSTPKAGKSLLAFDVAARLATGLAVLDRPAGDPVTVLYVDLEMTEDDLLERLEDMGFRPDDDLSRLRYHLLPDLPPLDTARGGRDLQALATAHAAELVVIDTTTSATAGAENDADTIRAYWRHTGHRLKADGRTVWRLDHAGKDLDRGQRGSSAKAGDVDLVWELTPREEGAVRLRATHRRMSWAPETIDLVRLDDPLRHERAQHSYPAGTSEVAELLDRLEIPADWGGRRVRVALREAGHGARNEVISAAIRHRRERR